MAFTNDRGMIMNSFFRPARVALAAAALCASPAFAATDSATTTLGVSANVTQNCVVSTSPVLFGDVDVTSGAARNGTGALHVTCTNGTDWLASADAGQGPSANLQGRRMSNGNDEMAYNLYTDAALMNAWGDGVDEATSLFSGTGTGSEQTTTIYGRIFGGQTGLPAGSYGDTVTVTVSY